eukprot:GHVS01101874.1.p1 GENE.GHVS01101874.1~~GHVS01101874.1.p1  ORF type:complete len:229 (+),score=0.65 GHVS01101874.1:42-728(+)
MCDAIRDPQACHSFVFTYRRQGWRKSNMTRMLPTPSCLRLKTYMTEIPDRCGEIQRQNFSLQNDNHRVEIKGLFESSDANKKDVGGLGCIPDYTKNGLLLTNPIIRWSPTGARSGAAGIWLKVPRRDSHNHTMAMVILFESPLAGYETADNVQFSGKYAADENVNKEGMWVPPLPARNVFFDESTWTVSVENGEPSTQDNESWREGKDAPLRIIYFSPYQSQKKTKSI